MTDISQDIVILDNEVFTKPFDKNFVKEEFAKRIAWQAVDFRLVEAKLSITVDQPATSGADLQTSVNGKRLDAIRWEAFDTEEKDVDMDVLSKMLNGINDFTFLFNAPNHIFQTADVQISATLKLVFRPLQTQTTTEPAQEQTKESTSTSTPPTSNTTPEDTSKSTSKSTRRDPIDPTPADSDKTFDKAKLDKFIESIKNNAKTIVIVGVVVGVITAVLLVWNNIAGTGKFSRFANFIRK